MKTEVKQILKAAITQPIEFIEEGTNYQITRNPLEETYNMIKRHGVLEGRKHIFSVETVRACEIFVWWYNRRINSLRSVTDN